MKLNRTFLNGKKVKLLPIFIALVILFSGTIVYLFRSQIFADQSMVFNINGVRTDLNGRAIGAVTRPKPTVIQQVAQRVQTAPKPVRRFIEQAFGLTTLYSGLEFKPAAQSTIPKLTVPQAKQVVVAQTSKKNASDVAKKAATHRAVEASVPRELSPAERVRQYTEIYGTANNYAAAAIQAYFTGSLSDKEAFDYLKAHPTDFKLPSTFSTNFAAYERTASVIKNAGGIEKYLQAVITKGGREKLDDKSAFDFVTTYPEVFGYSSTLKAKYDAALKSGKITAADVQPTEEEIQARKDHPSETRGLPEGVTESAAGIPQQETPVLDGSDGTDPNSSSGTTVPQTEGSPGTLVARSVVTFMSDFIKSGAQMTGTLSQDTVNSALDAAAIKFQITGSADQAYAAFVASLAVNASANIPDQAKFQEAMANLGAAQNNVPGAGNLLLLMDSGDIANLLTNNFKSVELAKMKSSIETAADLFVYTGVMAQSKDPFGIYTKRGDTAEYREFSTMMNAGIGNGEYMIASLDVARSLYKYGGKEAGDFGLAANWGAGDPKKTDLILNYMATDEQYGAISNFDDMVQRVKSFAQDKAKTYNLVKTIGKSSLGIDPSTGGVAYTSTVKMWVAGKGDVPGHFTDAGYISFDPIQQKYYGDLTVQLANKNVRLYSHPRTGQVYMSLSNTDDKALAGVGGNMLQLMSVSVAEDGRVGGSFKLANRLFTYNPTTSAFEVRVKDLLGDSLSSKLPNGLDLTVDSKGNVSGQFSLFGNKTDAKGNVTSKSNGALFFDSDGNAGFTYNLKTSDGKGYLAGVSIDIKGNISGAVNLGKEIFGKDLFVSFGKGGITGVSMPIGSVGVGINKNGGISLSYGIPIAGIPIPISLSQDAHGNFSIGIPFVGSLVTFGHENRDLAPPEIQKTEDGGARLECIYFYHSFKKLFQTVKVWNTDPKNKCPLQIEQKEQVTRSNKIFYIFNRLLGRNPSYQEFYSWYFYSAGDLANATRYAFEYGNKDNSEYRTTQLEAGMRAYLTTTQEYKYKSALVMGNSGSALQTVTVPQTIGGKAFTSVGGKIVEVKAPTNLPKEEDIMPYNPFDPDQVAKYQAEQEKAAAAQQAATGSAVTNNTTLEPFFRAVENQAQSDPYYKDGVYNIPADDTSTLIEGSATPTTTVTTTTTVTDGQTVTAEETVTATVEPDVSVTVTSGAQSAKEAQVQAETNAIETNEQLKEASITIKPGFNTVYVPRADAGWDIKPFADKGLVVYDFNPDGSKVWKLSSKNQISVLKPGIGYYVYNSGDEDVSVLTSVAGVKDIRPLRPGWNLLANSTSLYAKLTDLMYKVPKPDQPKCAKASCMMQISLFDMFSKTVANSLAYKNLFLIKDAAATTADKAFETIEVTADNSDNLVFAPGDVFWLYKWK